MIKAKTTKSIAIAGKIIGGNSPILVQSMCNTKTEDASSTVKQILALEQAGCEIIRVAVPNMVAAKSLSKIKAQINIPLVADIHFDYQLALEAINQGVDKIRLNPGNIGKIDHIKQVVKNCQTKNIPIRIGVNGGSLEKDILQQYNDQITPEALVASAMRHIKILEDLKFYNIIVSVKASDVNTTIKAYELLSQKISYPLHLGITEAGTIKSGTIKSCLGIGILLNQGLGDTIRISLTGDPIEEVKLAWQILKNLHIRSRGVNFTSCPGCGRTNIDLIKIANEIEAYCEDINQNLHIAIMGCSVNGIGEVKNADIGIVGGNKQVALYQTGKLINNIAEENIVNDLKIIIDNMTKKV